jgi:hypothetical protein
MRKDGHANRMNSKEASDHAQKRYSALVLASAFSGTGSAHSKNSRLPRVLRGRVTQ